MPRLAPRLTDRAPCHDRDDRRRHAHLCRRACHAARLTAQCCWRCRPGTACSERGATQTRKRGMPRPESATRSRKRWPGGRQAAATAGQTATHARPVLAGGRRGRGWPPTHGARPEPRAHPHPRWQVTHWYGRNRGAERATRASISVSAPPQRRPPAPTQAAPPRRRAPPPPAPRRPHRRTQRRRARASCPTPPRPRPTPLRARTRPPPRQRPRRSGRRGR